ncbi:MAG: hypothetical protein IJE46_05950 [Clostridia bacterium]|nr:hypothetical protein [Clostridia bacterium]
MDCSLEMLDLYVKQGVDALVATPHYYDTDETVNRFLSRRDKAYDKLMFELAKNGKEYPQIVLGAEVALSTDIAKNIDLEKLCIGQSNAILIELPYTGYFEWMTYEIYDIISKRKLHPVLAHFERFCNKKNISKFENLLSLDVSVQINADSFLDGRAYKTVKHLVKNNNFDVLGSDAHNITDRRSNFPGAVKKIQKKYGEEFLSQIDNKARKIIGVNK